MIQTDKQLEKQLKEMFKALDTFSDRLQNNINVSATREASNIVKAEIPKTPMTVTGAKGVYQKRLKKSDIRLKKRRRTKTGWERFKISIKAKSDDPNDENSNAYYNIMTYSREKRRYTKGGIGKITGGKRLNRGILKRDPFMQRATEISSKRGVRAYMLHARTRIENEGRKVNRKVMNTALKSIRSY
jgi:hypothetical protein